MLKDNLGQCTHCHASIEPAMAKRLDIIYQREVAAYFRVTYHCSCGRLFPIAYTAEQWTEMETLALEEAAQASQSRDETEGWIQTEGGNWVYRGQLKSRSWVTLPQPGLTVRTYRAEDDHWQEHVAMVQDGRVQVPLAGLWELVAEPSIVTDLGKPISLDEYIEFGRKLEQGDLQLAELRPYGF
jgi:hypothetical protein